MAGSTGPAWSNHGLSGSGGLTTGGLGATDIGNKKGIGGMSREFYQRVFKHYANPASWTAQTREDYFKKRPHGNSDTEDTMWTFEPHVATKIYDDMLKESNDMGSRDMDAVMQAANNGAGKACNAMCKVNVCGDGDKGPDEQCDDGNMDAGDGCTPLCKLEACGNGVADPGELCDDGQNGDQDDGCTDLCKLPVCGDGLLSPSDGLWRFFSWQLFGGIRSAIPSASATG